MAERRVYRRRPGFSYESAKDERKDEYSSDEENLDENVPSLVHQPDRPGQHRNIAKQRVYDENARPGIPSIRRRPARFKFDDDEEEDEEEYVPIRTPRKPKTDQNTPNHYDDNRRGGQKSPNINQEFCRRRNYSLRDRHHGFSFPKDVPRQRNYFPNEAPVYRRPPRDQRRVRGPQSLSELSIREDPRKHRVQANDFISDEDDDNSEYEEIRGQKHKFSGIRREHPDNARLLKGHWIYSEASTPGNEDYSDESEDERDVMHAGPEPVVPQEIKLTPGKLISVLAKKRDLRATLLQLLEYHHMKTHLVRRIVLANPHLFKMAGEIIEIRLNIKICTAHNGTRGCLNRSTCKDMQQKQRKLPAHWDEMKSNERVKRVVIASSGDEYKNILPLLGNISSNVTKIERVQNRFHWQAFQNKIEEMADIYGDPTKVNIRQLFHGTGHDIVPKICNENFDPKLHGQSAGQAYGQGTYFARDASLSFGYCKTDSSGLKYMFMAKVAVGSLTTGNSSMARPPINSSTGYPFDSTGDNATNPSIIVKYDKAEYFPEYILTLK